MICMLGTCLIFPKNILSICLDCRPFRQGLLEHLDCLVSITKQYITNLLPYSNIRNQQISDLYPSFYGNAQIFQAAKVKTAQDKM